MEQKDFDKIKTYDDFRQLAVDNSLSKYEKIGFPNAFRSGKEEAIFQDIRTKIPVLDDKNKVILDVGPGCSDLPYLLIDHCRKQNHTLILADSEEMLNLLPDADFIKKVPGFFPNTKQTIQGHAGKVDGIVSYSVFHYIFEETDVPAFIAACIDLLNDGGQILLGDIPNVSKRKRFFASNTGIAFHKAYMKTDEAPFVDFNASEEGMINDAVLDSIVNQARALRCDAYILPQPSDLPMSNRRDDLVIRKP